jgi:xylan 1,4-beta-xylosidase
VSPRLRVGGPATAQAAWVSAFLRHTHEQGVPVDFVSSHVYGNDTAANVLGIRAEVPRDQMVCRAVRKVHEEILHSRQPALPFILSEFNASYANEPQVTDSVYMGPWLAQTIRQCAGLADMMSYWSFSDVFEEQGVVKTPFYGGYGLLAERGIPKPAFNAFALLHKLGDRLVADTDGALVTARADGTLAIALWNYTPPAGERQRGASVPEAPKRFEIRAAQTAADAQLWRLDADHGNVLAAYESLGRPSSPTPAQIGQPKAAAQLPPPQTLSAVDGRWQVVVPPRGLAVLEIPPAKPPR